MAMPLINGFVAWALNLYLQERPEGVEVGGDEGGGRLRVEERDGAKEFVLNGRIIGPVEAVRRVQEAECVRGWLKQEIAC